MDENILIEFEQKWQTRDIQDGFISIVDGEEVISRYYVKEFITQVLAKQQGQMIDIIKKIDIKETALAQCNMEEDSKELIKQIFESCKEKILDNLLKEIK